MSWRAPFWKALRSTTLTTIHMTNDGMWMNIKPLQMEWPDGRARLLRN